MIHWQAPGSLMRRVPLRRWLGRSFFRSKELPPGSLLMDIFIGFPWFFDGHFSVFRHTCRRWNLDELVADVCSKSGPLRRLEDSNSYLTWQLLYYSHGNRCLAQLGWCLALFPSQTNSIATTKTMEPLNRVKSILNERFAIAILENEPFRSSFRGLQHLTDPPTKDSRFPRWTAECKPWPRIPVRHVLSSSYLTKFQHFNPFLRPVNHLQCGAPQVTRWFINPMKTIIICIS